MNKIVNIPTTEFLTGVLFLLLISFTAGCTLNDAGGNTSNITEEDLAAASQILGESLSSHDSGLSLSLTDALTNISSDGFIDNSSSKSTTLVTGDDRSGRGSEVNYNYSYFPETGMHNVSFERHIDRPLFSKEVTDTLKYVFTDSQGAFIEQPRSENSRIASIDFKGRREGTVETSRKSSFFVRTDTFLIAGVSELSPVLEIDGVHNGRGSIEMTPATGDSFKRSYDLEINFLNIEIEKALAQGSLQHGITGTLSWEMIIEKAAGGRQESKTMRGTIELVGDGTALLRFEDLLKRFQANLSNGDVKDQEREFEGRVIAVNQDHHSFTLQNSHQIFINEDTEIEDDDYKTLQQIEQAIQNGEEVWTEGEGYIDGNRFIATEVEFESNDGEDIEYSDFEDIITSVNLNRQVFTLGSNARFRVTDQTVIDDSGDYKSLQEVADAINSGIEVWGEGDAEILQDDPDADYRAVEVRFEKEEEEEDGDD